MELFTYLMAKNGHNTSVKKDLFSYLLGKNQSGTYTDYSGTSLSINNTKKGKMKINLLGNTSQTGTPTPSSPIPVNVVSGDNTITTSNGDNTQSTSYPIHLGEYELCKISTYQDRFIRTTGKNLFDKTQATTGYLVSRTDGTLAENSSYGATDFIPVKAGEQYTFTNFNYWYTAVYDENKNYLNNVDNLATITIPDGAYYLRGSFLLTNIDSAMFNEGTTTLPYEPYGTNEWYLEKKIGKVVLDGTEEYNQYSTTNKFFTNVDDALYSSNIYILCNKYLGQVSGGGGDNKGNYTCWLQSEATYKRLYFRNDSCADADEFTTFMTNNNATVYYPLVSPTYTQITGTLKDELEALQKAQSYKGTTNINQINNDLPFNMDVSVKVGN